MAPTTRAEARKRLRSELENDLSGNDRHIDAVRVPVFRNDCRAAGTQNGANADAAPDSFGSPAFGARPLLPTMPVPDDVARTVLEYADLPSRVVLASCSRGLQRCVFLESPWVWETIDFCHQVPWKSAAKITDDCLRALLQRANAYRVTKILRLTGCTSIRGLGIDVLCGSRTLEEIDLRLDDSHRWKPGPTGLQTSAVLGVLDTMLPESCETSSEETPSSSEPRPLGLVLVKLRRQQNAQNYYDSFSDSISDWLGDFHSSVRRKLVREKMRCGHCNGVLFDRVPRKDWSWSIPFFSFCVECRKFSCGQGDCPSIDKCYECLNQYCQLHGGCSACPMETMVYDCMKCHKRLCEGCGAQEWMVCEDCTSVCCDDCADYDMWCEHCESWFCDDCFDDAHEGKCAVEELASNECS